MAVVKIGNAVAPLVSVGGSANRHSADGNAGLVTEDTLMTGVAASGEAVKHLIGEPAEVIDSLRITTSGDFRVTTSGDSRFVELAA